MGRKLVLWSDARDDTLSGSFVGATMPCGSGVPATHATLAEKIPNADVLFLILAIAVFPFAVYL